MSTYPEYEAIIKECDKIRIVSFWKTIFGAKFGGSEQKTSVNGLNILGAVELKTSEGRFKPVLCCAKQMPGNLTECSSRRKQFDESVKVLSENFAHPYMGKGSVQGVFTQGLFFFFDETGNFRLSLVTCDIVNGKKELNNYRRQSFFVEAGARNNTFRTRICKKIDSFEELKNAFDVEKLSDEFFREYKVFYEDIVQYVTGARYIEVKKNKYERTEMSAPNADIFDQFVEAYGNDAEKAVRNYVKKLMGRLVFIQFLQKKGWLGIPMGTEGWTGGDKDFLQHLFDNVSVEEQNSFVDEVLEQVLFYSFNRKESDRKLTNSTLKKFKFPFLNCGLFDKDRDDNFDFALPGEVFHNRKFFDTERKAPDIKNWTKKRRPYFNDEVCGLFDFFDRFNFTIDENDPTDADVSVDPEMLGKIFENLLEDNKDKGAFYTPKEIVGYMCNESLIAYLESECPKIPSIRALVIDGNVETFSENERNLLDEKLADVKICDPAIGSGAFPMGLLNLLYKTRLKLGVVQKTNKKPEATLKRQIIQQNIYGVDIEKGAVDIAQLRFWLSLVVDETSPEALPNLEYKIMQGNSLLESFEGIDLSAIAGEGKSTRKKAAVQTSLVFDEGQAMESIQKNLNSFYNTDNSSEKIQLKNAINNEVKNYLKFIAPEKRDSIDALPLPNDKFFLWHTYFRDVFNRKGKSGFDIVIGNPPYVNVQLMAPEEKETYKKFFETFFKRCDMFCLFAEQGLDLSSKKGVLTFIIPSVVHTNMSYQRLRDLILNNHWLKEVCYTGGDVFHAPTVDTTILICNKAGNDSIVLKNALNFSEKKEQIVPADFFAAYGNVISVGDDQKNTVYDKLLNGTFDTLGEHFTMFQGIVTGNNETYIFDSLNDALAKNVDCSLLHPFVHGRDIDRYAICNRERRILYLNNEINIELYQGTKNWVSNFKEKLSERREAKKGVIKWYSLQWPREKLDLDVNYKILMQRTRNESLPQRIIATIDDQAVYGSEGIYFLIPKTNKVNLFFMLGLLNSKIINYLFATKFLNLAIKSDFVKQIRIPKASQDKQNQVISLVDSILAAKKKDPSADTSKLEAEIDKLVYELYGLTEEEIAIVEGRETFAQVDINKKDSGKGKTAAPAATDDWLNGEDL